MTLSFVAILAFSKDSAMERVWQIWLKPVAIEAEIHWALAPNGEFLKESKCRDEHLRAG
jgi:hypothetical protein